MTKTCPICNTVIEDNAAQCPRCGFKLQGQTQAFKPVDVEAGPHTAPSELLEEAELKIVKGPQTGSIFRLNSDSVTVGRSPRCDIFLNDMTVSRSHAIIERHDGHYAIVDQDSFNGLWVNGENVHEATLHDGDVIQVGTFVLQYLGNA